MKLTAIFLLMATVAFAQTHSTKPASTAAHTGATASATARTALQKGEMPAVRGIPRTLFTERYIDIKVGTGKLAEPQKLYHVTYTGYLAATGEKFDSTEDHRIPVMKDGKPVLGADGKPELGEPQPLVFPQGTGRLIPGFDQGFDGMHIGGKRRIFIPWQLAYGNRDIPARGGHVGIPPKSDLIFDVDLLDVTDMPAPQRPAMPPAPRTPTTPPTPRTPGTPPAASTPTAPAAPATPSTPVTPTTPPAPK